MFSSLSAYLHQQHCATGLDLLGNVQNGAELLALIYLVWIHYHRPDDW